MTAISNFTQAMKELTGFDEERPRDRQAEAAALQSAASGHPDMHTPHADIQLQPMEEMQIPPFDPERGSLITGTMVVRGDVESHAPLHVEGRIAGNVATLSDVVVAGKIVGDVSAHDLSVSGAIKGDLRVQDDTQLTDTAVIVGNITTENLVAQGKMKGNLHVGQTTRLASTAVVAGDITTTYLDSERGSVICGTVTTKEPRGMDLDMDKLFDIGEESW